MEVEEVIEDFAEREGRRLAARKGLEGICLAEILMDFPSCSSAYADVSDYLCMMDEGSGVRYMVTSLKRCLKLNLREDFGERHKVKYSLKEESSNICITEDSSLNRGL